MPQSSDNNKNDDNDYLQSLHSDSYSNSIHNNDDDGDDDPTAIDMSGGQINGPTEMIAFTSKISDYAITSLIVAGSNMVLLSESNSYNDDKHCNRAILALALAVKSHSTITHLDVSDNSLGMKGQSGLVAIADAVKAGILRVLDLSSNSILGPKNNRYDGMRSISSSLKTSSGGKLEELVLCGNSLNSEAVCFLGPCIVDCSLKVLDLSDNTIGIDPLGRRSSSGIKSMVASMSSNHCNLLTLNLSENYLGNAECQMIASVLEVMFSLRELDLSFNDIHAVGAKHLAETLRFNETLACLNLGGNHVQDGGAGDIADALRHNTALKSLILAANDLTDSSCFYFLDVLQFDNNVLVDLNIDENEGIADIKLLAEVMEWVKGNEELISMRENPDGLDLAVKSNIVRDCLFNKVRREDISVIAALVGNPSLRHDYDFFERLSHICPPDRTSMLRSTMNLVNMMAMTKEDRSIRLVQKAYRRMKIRIIKRDDEILKNEMRRKTFMVKRGANRIGAPDGAGLSISRAGKVDRVDGARSKASSNIVVR